MPLQVAAIEGELLLVSQFTLYGRLKKPKPDYSKAMGPEQVCLCGLSGGGGVYVCHITLARCRSRARGCSAVHDVLLTTAAAHSQGCLNDTCQVTQLLGCRPPLCVCRRVSVTPSLWSE